MNKLHLGCGHDYMDGYINLDSSRDVRADVYFNLEACKKKRLPFIDNTFDEIQANHLIEHIHNILPIRVPYGASASAFDDPTHIRQLYPLSFFYFGQPAYHRTDYGYRGDWQTEEIGLTVLPQLAQKLNQAEIDLGFVINHLHNIVHEMLVALTAVKPARPQELDAQKFPKPIIQILNEDGSIPVE
jgi:hypothetical protein